MPIPAYPPHGRFYVTEEEKLDRTDPLMTATPSANSTSLLIHTPYVTLNLMYCIYNMMTIRH